MAVVLYEGFDLNANYQGGGIHPLGLLDWDGSPDWSHGGGGSGRGWQYGPGYSGGQAMAWHRRSGLSAAVIRLEFSTRTEIRLSWFGKPFSKGSSTTPFITFRHAGQNKDIGIGHAGLQAGQAVLRIGTITGVSSDTIVPVSDTNVLVPDDWAHYEVYVNSTTQLMEIVIDGDLKFSETVAMLSAVGFDAFRLWGNGDSGPSSWWDHFILTDGESLRDTEGFHGIGVTWSGFGKNTGGGTGIRSRIDIGENVYYGSTIAMRLATVDNYSPREANTFTQFWMTNPETGQPWGNTINIDGWGLCRTDNTGGWLITPSAFLSYIVMNIDGEPLVQYTAPGEILFVDDTWVRTHENRPWHEHIDNYPRLEQPWDFSLIAYSGGASGANPNPFDATAAGDPDSVDWTAYTYDELWYEDYIGVTGPGCISFSFGAIEPPTTYGGTGLAFAEEYRVNYRDWQSLIVGGEDFCSYFITGYKIHGEASKKFQSNYLTVNYETDTLASAFIQGVWDYALGDDPDDAHSRSDTGRWGSTQQIYRARNDEAYKHAFAKLKIRGHGRAMQIKVKCETGKPFWINGWSMYVTGNSTT